MGLFSELNKRRTLRKRYSRRTSLPAPIGGWNARDNISDMKVEDAIVMDNWFPGTSDVSLRKGYTAHVTGVGNQVESLMTYNAIGGTQVMFGAAGTSFYNMSSAGSVGAAVVTGLTNSRWECINNSLSGGTSYLCCFNGTDSPRYYNGSIWITITGASSPAITGVTTADLITPWLHNRRMWTIEKNTLNACYFASDSVGGAATKFNLNGIANKGGSLVAGGTWTVDGGLGPNDYWVVVTSEGQAIVYSGTDPSSASTWSLVGVFNIGEPIGRRCLLKYGNELLVICVDGVYPLSKWLGDGRSNSSLAITDRINSAMTTSAQNYKGNFGWQLIQYPEANLLLLNIPVITGSSQEQYVMNTITKRWARFTGIDANCWEIFGNEIYFGGNGAVYKFWDGFSDNDTNINGDLKQAFSYFGARGREKKFNMMRPILLTNGQPAIFAGINIDYSDSALTSSLNFSPVTSATWDNATWDTGIWGGDVTLSINWHSIEGVGSCAAPRIVTATKGVELRLEAIDFMFENGGIFG